MAKAAAKITPKIVAKETPSFHIQYNDQNKLTARTGTAKK